MRHDRCGFTLIELLLVVAIIFLILMLTVPALMTVRRQALILACKSNMKQISYMIEVYRVDPENDKTIPYLFYAAEGMLDPEHMEDAETRISGLEKIVGNDRDILKCPADTGYGGVDYGLTPEGLTCFACFGQSYTYNNAPYTDPDSPYYGRGPVRFTQITNPERVVMVSDFSSVWHGAAGSGDIETKYYLNILYFDGHVDGMEFASDEEAKAYRNRESRWW